MDREEEGEEVMGLEEKKKKTFMWRESVRGGRGE